MSALHIAVVVLAVIVGVWVLYRIMKDLKEGK